MWELVYVLKKNRETVELVEIHDVEYYIDVLGYELDSTYDRYI